MSTTSIDLEAICLKAGVFFRVNKDGNVSVSLRGPEDVTQLVTNAYIEGWRKGSQHVLDNYLVSPNKPPEQEPAK